MLRHALVLALVLLAGTAAHAEIIFPEDFAERGTEAEFQRSKFSAKDADKALKRKRYKNVALHAEVAWKAYKSPTYAVMLGLAHGKLKAPKVACRWYLTALAMEPSSTLRARIDAGLGECKTAQLGIVELSVSPQEASLTMGGTPVSATWVAASAGEHTLEASHEGYEAGRVVATAVAGQVTKAELTLEKKKVVEPPKVEPPKKVVTTDKPLETTEPPKEPSIVVPLALIISGVVVAGGGAGLHAWGLGQASTIDDQNGTWAAQGLSEAEAQARVDSLNADASGGAVGAFVMYGIGAGLIVAGAVLWAMQDGPDEGSSDAGVVVAPRIGSGNAGLVLDGRF